MAKRRKHKRVPASKRRKILAEMASGGLTAKKVAKKYGVSPWTVYGWRKRAGVTARARKRGQPAVKSARSSAASRTAIRAQVQAILPGMVREELVRIITALAGGRKRRRK